MDGNTSMLPSRPPVVADRVLVMVCVGGGAEAAPSTGEATRGSAVAPREGGTRGCTIEDSVERRPIAGAVNVAVVAVAVVVAVAEPGSCVLERNGGGRELRGWVKAGTREKRLDRDEEGFAAWFCCSSTTCGCDSVGGVGPRVLLGKGVADVDVDVEGEAVEADDDRAWAWAWAWVWAWGAASDEVAGTLELFVVLVVVVVVVVVAEEVAWLWFCF
jgi:hypothetical protein